MNRSELIESLQATTQLPDMQVRRVVDGLFWRPADRWADCYRPAER